MMTACCEHTEFFLESKHSVCALKVCAFLISHQTASSAVCWQTDANARYLRYQHLQYEAFIVSSIIQ